MIGSPHPGQRHCSVAQPSAPRSYLSVKETGDHIDDQSNDHRSVQVGKHRVGESDPSDGLGRQIGVGNLKRHSDGQRQVGEIQIRGRVFLIEVDPPTGQA